MKKILIYFLPLLFQAAANNCYGQSLSIRAGRNGVPGDYLAIRYEGVTNSPLYWSGSVFLENSRKSNLQYIAYGTDLMLSYPMTDPENTSPVFSFRPALGITCQAENEAWIYADWSSGKRMNYGMVAELNGQWMMTDEFILSAFLQQKYVFNTALGNTRFAFGLGLSIHFHQ